MRRRRTSQPWGPRKPGPVRCLPPNPGQPRRGPPKWWPNQGPRHKGRGWAQPHRPPKGSQRSKAAGAAETPTPAAQQKLGVKHSGPTATRDKEGAASPAEKTYRGRCEQPGGADGHSGGSTAAPAPLAGKADAPRPRAGRAGPPKALSSGVSRTTAGAEGWRPACRDQTLLLFPNKLSLFHLTNLSIKAFPHQKTNKQDGA